MMGTKIRDDTAPALGKKGILAFKFPPLWRAPGGRPHQVSHPFSSLNRAMLSRM